MFQLKNPENQLRNKLSVTDFIENPYEIDRSIPDPRVIQTLNETFTLTAICKITLGSHFQWEFSESKPSLTQFSFMQMSYDVMQRLPMGARTDTAA